MMINCPTAVAALSADGDATGYITVADATPFYPTARVWLTSALVAAKEYVITDIASGGKIGLREIPVDAAGNQNGKPGGWQYGRTPVNQWLVTDSAKIHQEAQPVRVEHSNYVKV